VVQTPNVGAFTDKSQQELVDVASISGITVRELDWQELIRGLQPVLDPLAASIPADQHVMFLRDFKAALALADEADRQGTPVLQIAEPRSENAKTLERYQRQLGLSLGGAARMFGPQLIGSVALTGSDPYFRTGTDVAVLLEAKDPAALAKLLVAQVAQSAAGVAGAQAIDSKVQDVPVAGTRAPDRTICSYVAAVGPAVVVTNSPAQLERLISVWKETIPSIKSLPEYTFFRHRYPRGDAQETALLFLSDATIRRWCGPRWRIASSRRTLAAAALQDQQAAHLDQLVQHKVAASSQIPRLVSAVDLGQLQLTPAGVTSANY
jgi:hypothetical protein